MSSFDFNLIAPNKLIAGDTSNYNTPSPDAIGKGITLGSDLLSSVPNSLMYALSSQISYLQENGGFWLPLKEYNIGNIVRVPVIENGITKIYLCKCIANSNAKDYCVEYPFVGSYQVNNFGNLYFQNATLNSQYWEGVSDETLSLQKTSITDFNISYPSSQDSQIKNIQLIDLNLYSSNFLNECLFVLTIKRGGYRVDTTIKVSSYGVNSIELEVTSMKTNLPSNLAFDSSNSIFNPNSRFKDIALLGCFLSINQDKTISLNVCGRGSGASGSVEIETYLLANSNIRPTPVEKQRSYTFLDNQSNLIIPITEGASNKYLGVGEIIPFFGSLSFTNCFKNRLIPLNTEKTLDSFIYRGIQAMQGDYKLYSTQDRYLVQSSNSSRYINQSLPNIKGRIGFDSLKSTSTSFVSLLDTAQVRFDSSSDPMFVSKGYEGAFYSELNPNTSLGYVLNDLTYCFSGLNPLYIDQSKYSIFRKIDASRSSSIYQDGANVKPNSTKIYYYIRGW